MQFSLEAKVQFHIFFEGYKAALEKVNCCKKKCGWSTEQSIREGEKSRCYSSSFLFVYEFHLSIFFSRRFTQCHQNNIFA